MGGAARQRGAVEWLNYHHLLYFWTTAKEGSIAAASAALGLAPPTISGQIKTLEEHLGETLFTRVGRGLELTETGHVVYRYADEIFSLGRELTDTLAGRAGAERPQRLFVGISDIVPKLISHRLLEPALRMQPPVQLVCREDKTDRLLAELALKGLDLVFSDEPISASVRVKAYNHLLGECGVTFFGKGELARKVRRGFPQSLDGAPLLMPTEGSPLRRELERWFEREEIAPRIVAEFDDSALLKQFGQHGAGIFAAPTAIEKEIRAQYHVGIIAQTDEVREQFYAITVERRIKHPAVMAISQGARQRLFRG